MSDDLGNVRQYKGSCFLKMHRSSYRIKAFVVYSLAN